MDTILNWIQKWYLRQADGDWEHSYGVRIHTIDNRGWRVTIDLAETGLEDMQLPRYKIDISDSNWLAIWIENKQFNGAGDPGKLRAILEKFRDIVQQ